MKYLLAIGLFYGAGLWAAGNLHRQIDECDVLRDAECLKGILHQLARQNGSRAATPRPASGSTYCVCETMPQIGAHPYLIRVLPDGTKHKDKLGGGPFFPADCTEFILKHPACRSSSS